MRLLYSENWKDYELVDSGGFEKLERFGPYILRRPEPQALWRKGLSEKEWAERTNAEFRKSDPGQRPEDESEKGEWHLKKGMKERWFVNYSYKEMSLRFRLGLTAFKHVGIFPEQAENWNYIYDEVKRIQPAKDGGLVKVLNLFAYTGGASMAAKAAGADVTHVDSVRQVLSWSKENMEASALSDIRWVWEDALKFVERESRRGNVYEGIIMDPPAYGRGPKGEKWVLEDNLAKLMDASAKILKKKDSFCILNLYSMGFSSLIAKNIVKDYFELEKEGEFGELYLPDRRGIPLPLSTFCRFRR